MEERKECLDRAEKGGLDEEALNAYMRMAIEEGEAALSRGEVPVGCVFVKSGGLTGGGDDRLLLGGVISSGHNDTSSQCNASKHAEIVAMDKVFARDGSLTALEGSTLVVTCEPCIMCAAALGEAKVGRVYFGCKNDRFGGCGSILGLHDGSWKGTGISDEQQQGAEQGEGEGEGLYRCVSGVMEGEAIDLLRRFYVSENDSAPARKRRKKENRTFRRWKGDGVEEGPRAMKGKEEQKQGSGEGELHT